jgi:hypothetical protein
MSVATHLGLDDPDQGLLARARQAWPGWCAQHPGLPVVPDLLDLPDWVRAADPGRVDEVLHVLARLGSPSGGDDHAAVGALAWLLLPAACLTAHRLWWLTPRIDEVVAAQLWLEVRGFPWQRQRKVAANITMNTRRGVKRELGVGLHLRDVDPTWARSVPVKPGSDLWRVVAEQDHAHGDVSPEEEAAELLGWAVDEGVIGPRDRDLLVRLAVAAADAGGTRAGRGQGGLCSRRVSRDVALREGVSPSTVRRRATASLRAIATAYAQIPA